jgi:hypothetical protein
MADAGLGRSSEAVAVHNGSGPPATVHVLPPMQDRALRANGTSAIVRVIGHHHEQEKDSDDVKTWWKAVGEWRGEDGEKCPNRAAAGFVTGSESGPNLAETARKDGHN